MREEQVEKWLPVLRAVASLDHYPGRHTKNLFTPTENMRGGIIIIQHVWDRCRTVFSKVHVAQEHLVHTGIYGIFTLSHIDGS